MRKFFYFINPVTTSSDSISTLLQLNFEDESFFCSHLKQSNFNN